MKKSLAVTLLILLGAVVTLGIPLGVIVLQSSAMGSYPRILIAALAAVIIQTAAFVILRRLYKDKYGLSSPKFAVCSVLPSAVIPIIGIIVIKCMTAAGVFGEAPEKTYDYRAETELFYAWLVFIYAACFAITLSLALAAVSAIRKRHDCPQMLLAVFGNLLIFIIGGGIFWIWRATGWSIGLTGLLIGVIHIVFSTVSCRRFKREFDISPGKYVLYSAVPAFLICVCFMLIGMLVITTGMPVIGDIAAVPLFLAVFPAVYSVCYTSVLAVAAAFC